ncbi:Replication protein A subunit [Liparis tanakae]|uniref:Replication protein A subunit n=1 Tax=Liparis tanakae TaxID=230148 RepID=A0A4Z2J928_9TELE|nr:Replication protein A subunit [Liparis tanakae]
MWNQACSQASDWMTSSNAGTLKRSTLQLLPCTVSQLLSAQDSNDAFTVCGWELNQVSVVGVIGGVAPFVTNIQFSVDDMTGPPLNVKQWVNGKASSEAAPMTSASSGTYVKGQRSLLAMNSRRIKDLNEITSHMLDVVHAHQQHFGKVFDVNMNIAASPSGGLDRSGLSPLQAQVLAALRGFSVGHAGLGFHELQAQLDDRSPRDIRYASASPPSCCMRMTRLCLFLRRAALTFLTDEGHAFCTIDEHHFRSTEH